MYLQKSVDSLVFYKVMKFPVPKNKEIFYWLENFESSSKSSSTDFSWEEKSPLMEEFIEYINKFGWIYKSIPFVKNIYLCNSITFNYLNEESDIDLFLVCQKNRLWIARLFSVILFHMFRLRRHGSKVSKRFCLSFYVTQDNLNLYNLSLKPYDLYFTYWIAHLASLYAQDYSNSDLVFKENFWITNYIPNLKLKQNINLGNHIYTGNTFVKNFFETIFSGFIGNFFNWLIMLIWKPIMNYKRNKLGNKGWGMIITENVLKFHGGDIRKLVNFKYRFFNKNDK